MCSYCEGGDGPPNDDDDDSTALMWVTEAAATMDALRFYARQSTCEPDGSLGLVTVQGTDGSRVALMQWVLQGKLGRVADIDESFRVKAIVPVGAKKNPVEPHLTILQRTGVFMEKVRKRERPAVSNELLRLMKVFEVGMEVEAEISHAGSAAAAGQCEQCAYCEIDSQEGKDKPKLCSFCLLCVHDRCAESRVKPLLGGWLESSGGNTRHSLAAFDMPAIPHFLKDLSSKI